MRVVLQFAATGWNAKQQRPTALSKEERLDVPHLQASFRREQLDVDTSKERPLSKKFASALKRHLTTWHHHKSTAVFTKANNELMKLRTYVVTKDASDDNQAENDESQSDGSQSSDDFVNLQMT